MAVRAVILFASFFYCKHLSYAAIELMDTNLDKAMKDLFHAFLINATVITLVFYCGFVRDIFLVCEGFNQKCWPPADLSVGMKTKVHEGKAAQKKAVLIKPMIEPSTNKNMILRIRV